MHNSHNVAGKGNDDEESESLSILLLFAVANAFKILSLEMIILIVSEVFKSILYQ